MAEHSRINAAYELPRPETSSQGSAAQPQITHTPRVNILDLPDELLEQILSYTLVAIDDQPEHAIHYTARRTTVTKKKAAAHSCSSQPSALTLMIKEGRQAMKVDSSKVQQQEHQESMTELPTKPTTIQAPAPPVKPENPRPGGLRVRRRAHHRAGVILTCRRFYCIGVEILYQNNVVHCSSLQRLRGFTSAAHLAYREHVRDLVVTLPFGSRYTPVFTELHLARSDLTRFDGLLEGLPNLKQLVVKCVSSRSGHKRHWSAPGCVMWARRMRNALPNLYNSGHNYYDQSAMSPTEIPDFAMELAGLRRLPSSSWDEELRRLGARGKDLDGDTY